MNKTLKIISLLLSYPTAELQLGGEELKSTGRGKAFPGIRRLLDSLVDYVCDCDLYEAQERYVHLLTARARCRCIFSSMCMVKAATAARPWSIS